MPCRRPSLQRCKQLLAKPAFRDATSTSAAGAPKRQLPLAHQTPASTTLAHAPAPCLVAARRPHGLPPCPAAQHSTCPQLLNPHPPLPPTPNPLFTCPQLLELFDHLLRPPRRHCQLLGIVLHPRALLLHRPGARPGLRRAPAARRPWAPHPGGNFLRSRTPQEQARRARLHGGAGAQPAPSPAAVPPPLPAPAAPCTPAACARPARGSGAAGRSCCARSAGPPRWRGRRGRSLRGGRQQGAGRGGVQRIGQQLAACVRPPPAASRIHTARAGVMTRRHAAAAAAATGAARQQRRYQRPSFLRATHR